MEEQSKPPECLRWGRVAWKSHCGSTLVGSPQVGLCAVQAVSCPVPGEAKVADLEEGRLLIIQQGVVQLQVPVPHQKR
jgi:hypothetical protein